MEKNESLKRQDTPSSLSLIVGTNVMTLTGTWHATGDDCPSASIESPGSFDYLLNMGGINCVIHPDDRRVISALQQHPRDVHTLAVRAITPEGHIKRISLTGSFQPAAPAPSPDELLASREAVAREAMTKYQELFLSIDQGFAIIKLLYNEHGIPNDYFIDQTNPALERITGFKKIAGKRMREILPEAPAEWFHTLGKIIQLQKPTRLTVKSKELGNVWYDIYTFPTGPPPEHRLGILFTDITDRVMASEKLRDRQLKLELAQREARVGIWTYQPAVDQGMATREWMELTGYPGDGETWTLETFLSLVYPDDLPQLRQALSNANPMTGIEAEFRILQPAQGLRWFLARGAYRVENDSLIGIIIDITERKTFEEQKDQFIGIASHELKTPVTSIKAYAEILHDFFNREGDTHQSRMMARLINQVDRFTRLINDLLDTTRITGGGLVLEVEPFDLNRLIRDRVEELQRTTSHALILRTENLPAVRGDKDRIDQVLMNLLSNAIKYSPPASDIVVSTEAKPDHVVVRVRDFGVGMSEESQRRIFDRFYRVGDTRLPAIPGLGLGLFIAAEIIRKHNGVMGVDSRENKGSEFYFTLPL